MSNINDLLLAYYISQGAVSKNINDAEREVLTSLGASSGTWYSYLTEVAGLQGNINDMMMQYLYDKGYTTGSLSDRMIQAVLADDLFASAWTPASLPGIVDYGIYSDLTRLAQNSDGSGAVASVDDPVGWWRGQLDVVTRTQGNAANKPKYATDGVYFLAGGTSRWLAATFASGFAEAKGCSIVQRVVGALNTGSTGIAATWGSSTTPSLGTNDRTLLWPSGGPSPREQYRVRGTITDGAAIGSPFTGDISVALSYDPATPVASGWLNGAGKTNLTIGTNTTNTTHHHLVCLTAGDSKLRGWVLTSQPISDANLALIYAWEAAL
jgi:hypothetical protein